MSYRYIFIILAGMTATTAYNMRAGFMRALGHKIALVFSSGIELAVKVLFCVFIIPVMKYKGVVFTEPIIWAMCAIFLAAVYLKKVCKTRKNITQN